MTANLEQIRAEIRELLPADTPDIESLKASREEVIAYGDSVGWLAYTFIALIRDLASDRPADEVYEQYAGPDGEFDGTPIRLSGQSLEEMAQNVLEGLQSGGERGDYADLLYSWRLSIASTDGFEESVVDKAREMAITLTMAKIFMPDDLYKEIIQDVSRHGDLIVELLAKSDDGQELVRDLDKEFGRKWTRGKYAAVVGCFLLGQAIGALSVEDQEQLHQLTVEINLTLSEAMDRPARPVAGGMFLGKDPGILQ